MTSTGLSKHKQKVQVTTFKYNDNQLIKLYT